jgi:endonuclease/exonuclease/phosphatase (EEP) superfamily protein YafD
LNQRTSDRSVQFCLALLTAGMAGLAGALLGQLWEGFDLFSQFALQFMGLIAAGVLGLFVRKWRPLIAATAFGVMILGYSALPHVVGAHDVPLPTMQGIRPLKVASFNMWLSNLQVDDIKSEILRIDADVMVLAEVSDQAVTMLNELKRAYPHQYVCHESEICHLAIISKVPMRDTSYKVGWKGPPYIRATLTGAFEGLTVFGVHTTRFPHSRAQLRQVRALAKDLKEIKGRLIVMGDFNATPFSRVTQTIVQEAGLRRLTYLPTWPARWALPQVAIDHMFASPQISVLQGQKIGRPSGSDHYPIQMILGVPATTGL